MESEALAINRKINSPPSQAPNFFRFSTDFPTRVVTVIENGFGVDHHFLQCGSAFSTHRRAHLFRYPLPHQTCAESRAVFAPYISRVRARARCTGQKTRGHHGLNDGVIAMARVVRRQYA